MTRAAARRIVIGIGNPDRGDDAAGREVARLLRGRLPDDVAVAEHNGEATALLARLEGVAAAFLVDACISGAPTGTVRRFDLAETSLPPAGFGMSSHGLGLADAMALARALGRLPRRCIVYAIEGECFAIGAPLSPPVSAAAVRVASLVDAEIVGDAQPGRRAR